LVLSVDEKSQIQALDRTQPGLPLKKGRAGTMTHDYKRNGTTTLFAALDIKTREIIGECMPRHRAREFIRFLKKIDRVVAKSLDLHLIVDNYKTHKTKEVQAWLANIGEQATAWSSSGRSSGTAKRDGFRWTGE
jgi:transposase